MSCNLRFVLRVDQLNGMKILIKKNLTKLTYRTIYAVKTVNERRYIMKKNTTPVKLRDVLNNKKLSVVSGKAFIGDTVRIELNREFIYKEVRESNLY